MKILLGKSSMSIGDITIYERYAIIDIAIMLDIFIEEQTDKLVLRTRSKTRMMEALYEITTTVNEMIELY